MHGFHGWNAGALWEDTKFAVKHFGDLDQACDLPPGIEPGTDYTQATVGLGPPHTLLLYTDGVPEAMNPKGEMFGTAALDRVVGACAGDPRCMVDSLLHAVHAHEGGQRPCDDRTLPAIQQVN
jgi:sigma-B regulation protein RsbU (phosphoserine phosphatase)